MKRYIVLLSLFCGCARMQTTITSTNPTNGIVTIKTTKVTSFLSKSSVQGFVAGKETKTSSSLMSLDGAGTQTELEKLNALIESVVAGAVKGAK